MELAIWTPNKHYHESIRDHLKQNHSTIIDCILPSSGVRVAEAGSFKSFSGRAGGLSMIIEN